ncbi:hypothetical protein RSAG8_09250, partial [Rhizoctonia solani AG-8 WAC10335]
MPSKASIQEATRNNALGGCHTPLPQADDLETDGSSQEGEPLLTPPVMERCISSERQGDKSFPPPDCGATKSDGKTKSSSGLQAICGRTDASGQYFRLVHEYAESARSAAQVQLNHMVASSGCEATNYATAHPFYKQVTKAMNEQHWYMYSQAHGDLSGTPEVVIWDGLGWTSGAWNVYAYGGPGEVERFYSTE